MKQYYYCVCIFLSLIFLSFQGQCTSPAASDITSLISRELFEELLLHRNDDICPGKGFYTYESFIDASKTFPKFASEGDTDTRKREIAAFLAQTSHETTGYRPGAPDGPYTWGYCFVEETDGILRDYCIRNFLYPCARNKRYYGRGPFQLAYNINYGEAGDALSLDLINNPELVSENATVSFETAFWFWMSAHGPTPSPHNVIVGKWKPSLLDYIAGRLPGYGLITNIINGGIECGHGRLDGRDRNRVRFFKTYANKFGVSYGDNLDCRNQRPFGGLFMSKQPQILSQNI